MLLTETHRVRDEVLASADFVSEHTIESFIRSMTETLGDPVFYEQSPGYACAVWMMVEGQTLEYEMREH